MSELEQALQNYFHIYILLSSPTAAAIIIAVSAIFIFVIIRIFGEPDRGVSPIILNLGTSVISLCGGFMILLSYGIILGLILALGIVHGDNSGQFGYGKNFVHSVLECYGENSQKYITINKKDLENRLAKVNVGEGADIILADGTKTVDMRIVGYHNGHLYLKIINGHDNRAVYSSDLSILSHIQKISEVSNHISIGRGTPEVARNFVN